MIFREALILSGKCYWHMQQYQESCRVLSQVKVTSSDNLSFHHQKLLVDFYAFYGMSNKHYSRVIIVNLFERLVSGVHRTIG